MAYSTDDPCTTVTTRPVHTHLHQRHLEHQGRAAGRSGIKILSKDLANRRGRFIAAASLMLGGGVALAPGWATNNLWLWEDSKDQVREEKGAGVLFELLIGN
jgi:hypothetical protein